MARPPASDPPERLTITQKQQIVAWVRENYPELRPRLAQHWDECRDYHLHKGTRSYNWEAVFRRWLRVAATIRADMRTVRRERLSEGEVQHIFDVINGGKKS